MAHGDIFLGQDPSGLRDEVGHPYGVKQVDNQPLIAIGEDLGLGISSGNREGLSKVHKFGRNLDIDTGGFETIWNGGADYTGHNATVAETLEIFSSSIEDVGSVLSSGTATGGSGSTLEDSGATFVTDGVDVGDVLINDTNTGHGIVRSVTETEITVFVMDDEEINIAGDAYRVVTATATGSPILELYNLLDGEYAEQSNEYVVLNGTTPVTTTGQYMRCDRGHAHGGLNIGDITCRQETTTANVMMVMPTGYGATMICAYTIPAGKRAFIDAWFASLAGKIQANSSVRLMQRAALDSFRVIEERSLIGAGSSEFQRVYKNPKDSLPQMTDIKIMADTDANNTGVAAGFDLTLKDI